MSWWHPRYTSDEMKDRLRSKNEMEKEQISAAFASFVKKPQTFIDGFNSASGLREIELKPKNWFSGWLAEIELIEILTNETYQQLHAKVIELGKTLYIKNVQRPKGDKEYTTVTLSIRDLMSTDTAHPQPD